MQIQKIFSAGIIGNCLAIIAGMLLTLAFAPFGIFPLAILSPAILLALWIKVTKRQAFLRGFLFGLGFFATGVYWIFISVHTFGNTSFPFALLVTGGLISILALFPAFNGYLLNRYFPKQNPTRLLCAFPAIWVFLEWIRSWIFSGFPWLFLGYSQINSPLKGFAPLLSVYGVSLAVTLSSALLVNSILRLRRRQTKQALFNLLAIAVIWITGGAFTFIHWTKPEGTPVKISMVQGNIPQSLKWSPEQVLPSLNHYKELSQPHFDSRIIIWPESAIPIILQNAGSFLDTMSEEAKKHHTALITGIPVESPTPGSYYNAIITLGAGEGIYSKQRLVPFGEYVPLSHLFQKLFAIMDIPMSDFISGPHADKPIQVDNLNISSFICYEIAFPEQVRNTNENIGVILTISNDAWFGHSIAQAQHLEMGRMRAVEMGRPVLSASNDGITAIIKPNGKIQAIVPQYQSVVLTDTVQAYTGKTPWQRAGMDPILIILVGLIIAALMMRKK
jgi:apolipoprotein N-acyltransferase